MKLKLAIAVLALSTFALAQHGGGGRPAGVGAPMGGGAGNGSSRMGSEMGATHGPNGQPMGTNTTQGRTPTEILSQNTKLSSNLEKLLPQGMTAQQACAGFKNLGQCVAAIHVSQNLGIPFNDLKTKMTGTSSEALGKAIGDLKPAANPKAESKKAEKQAKGDLKGNS